MVDGSLRPASQAPFRARLTTSYDEYYDKRNGDDAISFPSILDAYIGNSLGNIDWHFLDTTDGVPSVTSDWHFLGTESVSSIAGSHVCSVVEPRVTTIGELGDRRNDAHFGRERAGRMGDST